MSNDLDKIGYLDDILLEMESLDDTFEKAIARYEYPFADGADLEDMGQKAHTVKIRCFFYDNGEQATYADHITLLNLLEKKSDFTLWHPKYGQLTGKIERISVRSDDRERCAEVDIDFIEQMREQIGIDGIPDLVETTESQYAAAVAQQETAIAAAAIDAVGAAALTEVPIGVSIMQAFAGKMGSVRAFSAEVDSYLGHFDSLANSVTNPANSLVASITFATNLPGRLLGTITRVVERYARLYDSIATAPARFLASLDNGLLKLQATLEPAASSRRTPAAVAARVMIARQVKIACAQRLALEASYLYQADSQTQQPAMNVTELEGSLSLVRQRLQEAIDLERTITSLQPLALALQQYVSDIKTGRETLTTVTIDASLPLHIICLRYGLPAADAERLQRLNSFRNSNVCRGEVQIYVR